MYLPHRQSCHVLSVFVDPLVMRSGMKTIGLRAVTSPSLRRVFKASKLRRCTLATPTGSHGLPSLPRRPATKDVRRQRREQHIAVNASHSNNGDAAFAKDDYVEAVIDRGMSPHTPVSISSVWASDTERGLWRRDSSTEGWTGLQTVHVRRRSRNIGTSYLDRQKTNGLSFPVSLLSYRISLLYRSDR